MSLERLSSQRVTSPCRGSTTSTQCGSGQHANTWAHSLVASGMADIVVVCGVESMSHVPMTSQIPVDENGHAYLGERYTGRANRYMIQRINLKVLNESHQMGSHAKNWIVLVCDLKTEPPYTRRTLTVK